MSTTTTKTTTRNTTKSTSGAKIAGNVPAETEAADIKPESERKLRAKDVDLNQYVTVRNGFQGMLIYISKRTGEVFEWDEFGAEQEMELGELKNAKNSNKNFFINNWFMFDDPWIIDFLGVGQFYKNTLPIDDFDSIFEMSAAEAEKVLKKMPEGQKRSVAYRARQLIADGVIDSMKLVSVLEKELGVDLVEH